MTNWDQLRSPVTDASMDAIVIVDPYGNVILFNPAAEALFGYDPKDILGRPAEELIAPANREVVVDAIKTFRATGHSNLLGKRTYLSAWFLTS